MCCSHCFSDEFLKDFIERNADETNACSFCGSLAAPRVDPSRLAPYFEGVLEAYVPRGSGQRLSELWAKDWAMFSEQASSEAIVNAVLGDSAIPNYVARESAGVPTREIWSRLRSELQRENRFFPANAPDRELFRSLIENLVTNNLPEQFYRARIVQESRPYALPEMGAPPAERVSDGRANPFGIRYLYLADEVETAIAEVKPSKGAQVCVAQFEAATNALRLVDLSNPRLTISPFRAISSVSQVRSAMPFLVALGVELSVPTQPHRATLDYLASQYLCELIKVCGYDGVVYRSSLGGGKNYAFFDASACEAKELIGVFEVADVAVKFRRLID